MTDKKNKKAWVLMAWPHEEVWAPVAVITDEEEAARVERVLTCRIHGHDQPRGEYPQFDLREVDLNPEILDTGSARLMKLAEDSDAGDLDMPLPEAMYDWWEDGPDVYSIVTAPERNDPEYGLEAAS